MKRQFVLILAAVVVLLTSCPNPVDNSFEPAPTPSPNEKTTIVFDNTKGICAVTVYSYGQRTEQYKIAEVDAGSSSAAIEWAPSDSYTFYFTYLVTLNGVENFIVPFVPEIGRDQVAFRIDADMKNIIPVPRLDETVSSPDATLSKDAYISIQNMSSYSFRLSINQSILVRPENAPSGSGVVNSGDTAVYKINPGSASSYSLLVGADYQPFTGVVGSFVAGHFYQFVFSIDAISLFSEIEIKQESVLPPAVDGAAPPAPAAPTLIPGDSIITAQWNAVNKAQSYKVYISADLASPVSQVKTVSSTTTVFTGLTNQTLYYVWVRAVNSSGESNDSIVARASPWSAFDAPETPGLPSIFEGVNQLTVTWQKAGGASSYEVYVDTSLTPPATPVQTTTTTSAVITGLENRIYYVWVRTRNSAGMVSGYSDIEAGTPRPPSTPPAAPVKPVLRAGSHEIIVDWQGVESASVYEVWYDTEENPAAAIKHGGDITDGITQVVITGLDNGTTYYVWVRARNAAGTGAWSEGASVTPQPDPPGIPGGLAVTGTAQTTISLSWNAVSGADNYKIYRSASSGGTYTQCGTSSSASYTDSGLSPGTAYYYKVSAVNGVGESGHSAYVRGQTSALLTVTELNLSGLVTAPVRNAAPQTTAGALGHSQYAVTSLEWKTATDEPASGVFSAGTVYQAVLGLRAQGAYSFGGLDATAFIFDGATSVTAAFSGGRQQLRSRSPQRQALFWKPTLRTISSPD